MVEKRRPQTLRLRSGQEVGATGMSCHGHWWASRLPKAIGIEVELISGTGSRFLQDYWDEIGSLLELVPGNPFARMKRGLHGESGPDVDHAKNFVDNLMGIVGAGPPGRGLEVVVGDAVDDGYSAS